MSGSVTDYITTGDLLMYGGVCMLSGLLALSLLVGRLFNRKQTGQSAL